MSSGEALPPSDVDALKRAIRNAEQVSGLKFSLYLGDTENDPRAYAERMHASLADADHSVLVLCDVENRHLEIVTGTEARRVLDDVECAFAAASMQSSFSAGDIVGGLTDGIQHLGEAANEPKMLHAKG